MNLVWLVSALAATDCIQALRSNGFGLLAGSMPLGQLLG